MMMKMAMKMSAASVSLLLLCCYAISSTDSQDTCDIYAARGDDVSVPLGPGRTLNDLERLKWTYNNDMVLFNRIKKTIIRGKKEDIHENGSLWLKSVTVSNNGAYKPEVQDASGKNIGKELQTTRLCVLERVPKPSVSVECKKNSVIFTCKFAQHASDTMEWLKNDKVEAKYKGEWKVTKEAKQVQSDSFRCSVSTRLGVMKSDAVTQNCDKGEKGEKGFWMGQIHILGKDIYIWIIVAGGGGLVLLLIILVIICCVCTKRKNRRRRQEMRLEWTKKDLHNHQHAQTPPQDHPLLLLLPPPHHHPPPQQQQQQQPAGHTGPRKHRSKRDPQQKPRVPEGNPEPSPRRAAQLPRPAQAVDEEQPPPLPQPRKKGPRAQRV
ncbi:T-cell surface antigen CD2-like [Pseudochaenichthys georgianus]|uniref:T-cell surface antigen CD2-like n=1 Tax=Pseudochaenichthys georgianus TaxID=52239 RepID=UPI00146A22D4|nr:T-cell surface antigen CD2-like isoform X2 [Pseudochaenichthys georgianus]